MAHDQRSQSSTHASHRPLSGVQEEEDAVREKRTSLCTKRQAPMRNDQNSEYTETAAVIKIAWNGIRKKTRELRKRINSARSDGNSVIVATAPSKSSMANAAPPTRKGRDTTTIGQKERMPRVSRHVTHRTGTKNERKNDMMVRRKGMHG